MTDLNNAKKNVANRIRERREYLWRQHGIHTQKYVASRLGISTPTYTRWELGQVSITAEDLFRLADILECNVTDFLPGAEAAPTGPTDPEADQRTEPPDIDIVTHNRAALTPEERRVALALVRAYLSERRAQRKTD